MLAPVQPLPLIHLPSGVDIRPIPMGHVAGTLPQVLVPIGEAVHAKAVAFASFVVPCGGGRGGGLRLCGLQTDLVQSSSLPSRGDSSSISAGDEGLDSAAVGVPEAPCQGEGTRSVLSNKLFGVSAQSAQQGESAALAHQHSCCCRRTAACLQGIGGHLLALLATSAAAAACNQCQHVVRQLSSGTSSYKQPSCLLCSQPDLGRPCML